MKKLAILASILCLTINAYANTPTQISDCVTTQLESTVKGYYNSNKNKSPNYGANWYRVLIAFETNPMPAWVGTTIKPTKAYTAKEAEQSYNVWSGWKNTWDALKCIEKIPAESVSLPDAVAPTTTINVIPNGDEGTTVSLSATLTGGTYDGSPTYNWSVAKGTLNDNTLASPTWIRPDVNADSNINISLTIIVRGSGTNTKANTSDSASSAVSALVLDVPPPSPTTSCVSDSNWDVVDRYYNSNKNKSPNYGANWYRVLIAYRSERTDKTLPTWVGSTSKPTTPYTVKGAKDGEKVWSGWTSVRKVLECLYPEQSSQTPQAQQDQQITTHTITVSMPNEVTEGDDGTRKTVQPTISISPVASHTITLLIKGSTTAGSARPTNFSSGNPVWHDGTANPYWDYAFNGGGFHAGFDATLPAGGTGGGVGLLRVNGDNVYEDDETIGLVVSCKSGCSGSNYTVNVVNDATPTIIKDNDPAPVYTISASNNITEGAIFDVAVQADRKAQASLSVPVVIDDVNDIGYVTERTKQAMFDSYSQTKLLYIPTTVVSGFRYDDTVTVTLQNPTIGTLGSPLSATVDVIDSEAKPVVNIQAAEVVEGNDIVINVTADKSINQDYTLKIIASAENAVAQRNIGGIGSAAGSATMLAGERTLEIRVPTVNDNRKNGDGTFNLLLSSGGSAYSIGGHIIGYKLKDSGDSPKVTLSASSTVNEGDDIVVTLTADKAPNRDYEVNVVMQKLNANDPDDIVDFSVTSFSPRIKAGSTTNKITITTTDNNMADGDVGVRFTLDAKFTANNRQQILDVTVRDSELVLVPSVEFAYRTNSQGDKYVCQNVANPNYYDEVDEISAESKCSLSFSNLPSGESEIDLWYIVTREGLGREPTRNMLTLKVNSSGQIVEDNSGMRQSQDYNNLVDIHGFLFQDHGVDQGKEVVAVLKLLPDPTYSLRGNNDVFITVHPDPSEDFFSSQNQLYTNTRVYDSDYTFSRNTISSLDSLLGEILEVQLTTSFAYHKSTSFPVRVNVFNGAVVTDLIDNDELEEIKGTYYLKTKAVLKPYERNTIIRIPLKTTRFDREITYDPDSGYATHLLRLTGVCPIDVTGCSMYVLSASLTYRVYPPYVPLDPDHPDYVQNAHTYTAKQCVEKNIPNGMICGGYSTKVIIDMPDEVVENSEDAAAYIYPSSGALENLTVRVTEIEKSDEYGNRIEKIRDITIPPDGLKYDLRLNNDKDERDREFEYHFQMVGASNWVVHPDHARQSIKIIDDEPTVFEWSPNTLTNTPDEGGFQRIAKFAIHKTRSQDAAIPLNQGGTFWQAKDVMTWDFNFGGDINLVNTPPKNCLNASDKVACNKSPSDDPNGIAEATIPVYVTLDQSTRTGLDTFTATGRSGPGNGWTMQMMVGEDTNDVDEIMTSDLQIILSQSGGGVIFTSDDPFPAQWIIYDDEKAYAADDIFSVLNDKTLYLTFTSDSYQVLESQGPGQPVIRYYNKDNNGNKINLCAPSGKVTGNIGGSCVLDSNGVNIRKTTLKDTAAIYVKATGGTATGGSTSDTSSDYRALPSEGAKVLLIPGHDVVTAKFDIHLHSKDDDYVNEYKCNRGLYTSDEQTANCSGVTRTSGDETIELAIDTATLPTGIQVDPDGHGTTTVNIVNSEQDVVDRENAQANANKCDPDHADYDATLDCNKPMLDVTGLTSYRVAENNFGVWVQAIIKNKSKTHDFNGLIKFKTEGPCVRRVNSKTGSARSLPKNGGTYKLWMRVTPMNTGGSILHPQYFTKGDDPSCNIIFSLRDGDNGSYIALDSSQTLHIADVHPTNVSISKYPDATIEDHDTDSTNPHIKVWLTTELFSGDTYVGENHRSLKIGSDEIIEFPIKAKVDGTVIDASKYKLSLVESQPNVTVSPLSDNSGYSVKIVGSSSTALTTNTHDKCYGGTTSSNRTNKWKSVNHVVCLNVQTAINVDDATTKDIEFVVDYTDKSFGDTNVGGGFGKPQGTGGNKSVAASVSVKGFETTVGTNHGAKADPKTLTLHIRQTTVTEPEAKQGVTTTRDQSWVDIPMDVVMNPGPSAETATRNRQTYFDFCVDKANTTASYYYDWRIVNHYDHIHNAAVGGYAWNTTTGCTKGAIYTEEIKKRMYLRVHGDFHDDTGETIALKIKVVNPGEDNVSVAGSTITVTINNEGPMPKAYLARYGLALGEQAFNAIEQRMTISNEHSNTFNPQSLFNNGSISYNLKDIKGLSLWSNSSYASFNSQEEQLALTGTTKIQQLGIDFQHKQSKAGLMVMRARGSGNYNQHNKVQATTTAFVPYVGRTTDKTSFWGMLGQGSGDLALIVTGENDKHHNMTADTNWLMGAISLKRRLGQTLDWSVDGLYTQTQSLNSTDFVDTSSQAGRIRTGLSGDVQIKGLTLTPTLRGRWDYGDAGSGYSLEYGGRVNLQVKGWQLNFDSTKTSGEVEQRRQAFGVSWKPNGSGPYWSWGSQDASVGYKHVWSDLASWNIGLNPDRIMFEIQLALN